MLRIEKLTVANIGPFGQVEFIFPEKTMAGKAEIQLFTGENGTGKTTILEMLAAAVYINGNLPRRCRSNAENSHFTLGLNTGESTTFEKTEKSYVHRPDHILNIQQHTMQLHWQAHLFEFAFYAYSGYRKIVSTGLQSIKEIADSPFQHATDFNAGADPSVLINWIANQKTKEALALMRKDFKTAEETARAIHRIEHAIERIIDEKIGFELLDNPLHVAIKKGGVSLDFDVLPDGLKAMISWIADLLMRLDRTPWKDNIDVLSRNFILFLDEIDVHLHPAWQRKILPIVQDLFPNAQIFLTTHSPFVVGSTDGVWVHKLISDGKDSHNQPPVLSKKSKSFDLILDEIFDVRESFGVRLEEKLLIFRKFRNRLLHSGIASDEDRRQLTELIAFFKNENSIEIDNIIGSELRQLSRMLKENFQYA